VSITMSRTTPICLELIHLVFLEYRRLMAVHTRHLVELCGLVVKAGVVGLTGDDRTTIYGAMIWIAEKLKSDERDKALALRAEKGKDVFESH